MGIISNVQISLSVIFFWKYNKLKMKQYNILYFRVLPLIAGSFC